MKNTDKLAKILWEYLQMHQKLVKSDAIIVLGSRDVRVAERGAELFLEGLAPVLIFSGGYGRFTKDVFRKPEAEIFADIAIEMGVLMDKIIIENKSTNSGENALCVKKLLEEKKLPHKNFILVQKPYMERRAVATFNQQWPEAEVRVTSPQIAYGDYHKGYIDKDAMISVMVGDLQRIIEYPKLGYQTYQEVPANVLAAYNELIDLGYTNYLIYQ
jgi:uncharacterized SAM-binding protein YcdF (DUF218 family)